MTSPAQTRSHNAASAVALVDVADGARDGLVQLGPERRATRSEMVEDGPVIGPVGCVLGGRRHERQVVAEHEPDPAVASTDRAGAGPDDLAAGAQFVEHRRAIVLDPHGQHVGLERRRHQRGALEDRERLGDPVGSPAAPSDALPERQESGECVGFDGFDLVPQRRERPPPQPPEHLFVAPFAFTAAGTELAGGHRSVRLEIDQRAVHSVDAESQPPCDLPLGEGAVGAGIPGDEIVHRPFDRFGEGAGQAGRQGDAERIAQPGRVLDGGPTAGTGDGDLDRSTFAGECGEPVVELGVVGDPNGEGRPIERAEHPEQIVHIVEGAGTPAVGETLQLELEVGEHVAVDQFAQFLGAEQVAQEVAVEGQRRGPALGERSVAFVHVDRDPAEDERLRERRCTRRLDGHDAHHTPGHVRQQRLQAGQVEDVVQALAGRLEQDREVGVVRGHGQQVGGTLALLPQRRALIGTSTRQQQRSRGALTEPGAEHRRRRELFDDQILDCAGVGHQRVEG